MRLRLVLIVLVLIISAGIGGYLWYQSRHSLQAETANTSNASLPLFEVTINGTAFTAESATTIDEQSRGLSFRKSLPVGHGMLFTINPPEQSIFWMKDMLFNLDMVWIRGGKVIGVTADIPAPAAGTAPTDLPNYQAPGVVNYVLEINAGAASTFKVGDSVVITQTGSI